MMQHNQGLEYYHILFFSSHVINVHVAPIQIGLHVCQLATSKQSRKTSTCMYCDIHKLRIILYCGAQQSDQKKISKCVYQVNRIATCSNQQAMLDTCQNLIRTTLLAYRVSIKQRAIDREVSGLVLVVQHSKVPPTTNQPATNNKSQRIKIPLTSHTQP